MNRITPGLAGAPTDVDVVVIGLGITGVGVALDAVTRGRSVLAVDAHDLAFGTSRWSSKLVHGGLRYLAKFQFGVAHESAVERLVGDIIGTVRRLRENELFLRIVDLDPELILPYLFSRRGRSQEAILELTVAALREAQAAGEARAGNPDLMERAMLLAAHGFVLSAHTMVGDEVSLDDLDAELRRALTRGLLP